MSLPVFEPKPPKFLKTLINDCYGLDLYLIPRPAELVKLTGGEHLTYIVKRNHCANLFVSADAEDEAKIKVRVITAKQLVFNQAVELTTQRITFGIRRYFKCACGRRTNSLYLKRGQFKCRRCHGLVYEITRLKKGSWLYKLNRMDKIHAAKHQVRNITYRIGFTMKARRVMALINKHH